MKLDMDDNLMPLESASPPRSVPKNLKRLPGYSAGVSGTGNSLIRGDNLQVLSAIKAQYSGAIRCVYLDPPYNNGDSYVHYDDKMDHASWLDSIILRLKAIAPLLSSDGSVWISIDDSELHYLKVAADSIFGRKNFIGTIVWERRTTRENRKNFSRNHEYILAYAKDLNAWNARRNSLPITNEINERYKNLDNDPRGPWQSVSLNVQDGHATPQQYYTVIAPGGRKHYPPPGRCWIYSESRMKEEIASNNIWFGARGDAAPRLKKFLSERKVGVTPETLWRAEEVGTTTSAKKHLLELFKEIDVFDTPKPETLIHRIFHIATDEGDLILDPYLGSGTSAAVAHKMKRNYIGVEQGHHIVSHCTSRLKKVIAAESGGVSNLVSWTGGGGFDFYTI